PINFVHCVVSGKDVEAGVEGVAYFPHNAIPGIHLKHGVEHLNGGLGSLVRGLDATYYAVFYPGYYCMVVQALQAVIYPALVGAGERRCSIVKNGVAPEHDVTLERQVEFLSEFGDLDRQHADLAGRDDLLLAPG